MSNANIHGLIANLDDPNLRYMLETLPVTYGVAQQMLPSYEDPKVIVGSLIAGLAFLETRIQTLEAALGLEIESQNP